MLIGIGLFSIIIQRLLQLFEIYRAVLSRDVRNRLGQIVALGDEEFYVERVFQ